MNLDGGPALNQSLCDWRRYLARLPTQLSSAVCGMTCCVVLLTGCGSGSSSGSSAAAPGPQSPAPTTSTAVLTGLAPTSLSFDLDEAESASMVLRFSNSGDAVLTYSFSSSASWLTLPPSGTLAAGASASVSITATCGGVDLSGAVVMSTNDPDEVSVSVPVSAACTPIATSAQIDRVTINQAARAFDSAESAQPSIGLLAGRETLVRAFVTTGAGGGVGTPPEARVRIETPAGAELIAMQAPAQIDDTPGADSVLGANYFAVVPGNSVTANAQISVEIGPVGNATSFPQSGPIALDPVDPGVLEITFVPVTFQGQTPSIDIDASMRQSLQVLPIGEFDVEVRAPYTFSGAYDLDRLLNEIMDLRNLDGSSRLYHGVIIPPNSSTSNTAGIGFVGFPVSVSVDLGGSQFIIAHELGHNLNLGHAPGCGSPNPDPNFPNASGNVTDWGYDIHSNALVAPTAGLFDFMSYCGDLWTSGYHFAQAIEHRDQSPIGFRVLPSQGLSVSGRFSGTEVSAVHMLPTEHYVAQVVHGESRFLMRGWDRTGNLVLEQSFDAIAVEDQAEAYDRFAFSAPLPTSPIYHYEVYADGELIFDQTLDGVAMDQRGVDIEWSEDAAVVEWEPQPGEALVVRDARQQVLAVDRSGLLSLSMGSEELELELVRANMTRERLVVREDVRNTDVLFRSQ